MGTLLNDSLPGEAQFESNNRDLLDTGDKLLHNSLPLGVACSVLAAITSTLLNDSLPGEEQVDSNSRDLLDTGDTLRLGAAGSALAAIMGKLVNDSLPRTVLAGLASKRGERSDGSGGETGRAALA